MLKKGWTSANELKTGDMLLLSNGNYAIIEKIQNESLKKPVLVYNFEVADFHTYFVGKNSVLVHNECKKFDANQQAVIELAKENKNGLNRSEAHILVQWAKEYGISAHVPMIHPNRSGIWSTTEHIKIFNMHIPIK